MIITKITSGWVYQSFDTDTQKWIKQEFEASKGGDVIDYDTENVFNEPEIALPFDMVQPKND